MPIDPSIPLRATQPRQRQRDPMRDYANMLQIQEAQDTRAKRNAFEQAAAGAVGPDGQIDYDALRGAMAQTGNVMGAVDLDSTLSKRDKNRTEAETAQYNQYKQQLDITGRVVAGVRDQASWDRARASLSRFGLNGDSLPEQYDPATVDQLRSEALTASQQLDQMWKSKEFGLSERRTRAAEREPLVEVADPQSPTGTVMVPRSQAAGMPGKPASGTSFSVDPSTGEISFSQGRGVTAGGNMPLDKPNARAAQEDMIAGLGTVQRLQDIKKLYDPAFMTYRGRVENTVAGVADKAGVASKDQRDSLGKRRQLTQVINREFNAYRKLITGAAASVQELESLKKAMISEDLGPAEFEAAFNQYALEVKRGLRLRAKLLREGVPVGSERFGTMFDSLYLGGQDDMDVGARAAQLEAAGIDEARGTQILKAEGYM